MSPTSIISKAQHVHYMHRVTNHLLILQKHIGKDRIMSGIMKFIEKLTSSHVRNIVIVVVTFSSRGSREQIILRSNKDHLLLFLTIDTPLPFK